MSETFTKILVTDDRIACITDQVKYAVVNSGQNITSQPFSAISETPTSHIYNIVVPSLEAINKQRGILGNRSYLRNRWN